MIFRDGRQVDTYSVSYSDVKNGTVPRPTFEQPPVEPDVPVDTNPDEGNGEEGSNEEDDVATIGTMVTMETARVMAKVMITIRNKS